MTKTIMITGSTDGIGLLTAEILAEQGHTILLHGRNEAKLNEAAEKIGGRTECFVADLSSLDKTRSMASRIIEQHEKLDVLINNAGVLKAATTKTPEGLDVRFVVNTFAPYVLTRALLPIMPGTGRVVNLSSAAQAPVNLEAMAGKLTLDDMAAYAQSKLAITIWTREMAVELPDGPMVVAVNPGSLLASKMVKQGFGIAGNDLRIGADILCDAALSDAFLGASGKYYDNDAGSFGPPHAAALDLDHAKAVMQTMERIIAA